MNQKINKLFYTISRDIYQSDMKNADTKGWWPIRPTVADYPLAPFLFSELIRLLRKSDSQNIPNEELAELFSCKEEILDLQYLWPCLSWKQNDISYEDKLYLVTKLIDLTEIALEDTGFISIYEKLAIETKESNLTDIKEILKIATRIYLGYVNNLYQKLGEGFDQPLQVATGLVLAKYNEAQSPAPWGDTPEDKAIRQLFRNCDFRREKEKGLEQVLSGVPVLPGIAEGVIGENIIVGFTIETENSQASAFITNIDPFKQHGIKEKLLSDGVVVIGQTRNGTSQLHDGDKVWVDGTSGIVYKS